ncbi:MAG: hypothetical protein Q7T18_09725 [Sedimentisphaerales bacterium]|nr:hypothetical protein [Sedimentisphaerales bacterium]
MMDSAANLEELLRRLEDRNIAIRRVPLGGSGGGLCKVRGDDVFFIDTEADTADTVALCVEAIAKLT